MLLWYTGDEPDGQVDALNATKITYDLVKSLDPYHPVSLCLNCLNYYFEDYTSGADIIMSDPYPIAVNTSWSVQCTFTLPQSPISSQANAQSPS